VGAGRGLCDDAEDDVGAADRDHESGGSGASVIFVPFSCVPLVEPMSRTMARSPSQRISTWRRLVPASGIVMSASLPRPMTVRPSRGCARPAISTTPRQATWPAAVCEATRSVPVERWSPASAIVTGRRS
jgi:hypothetical protein